MLCCPRITAREGKVFLNLRCLKHFEVITLTSAFYFNNLHHSTCHSKNEDMIQTWLGCIMRLVVVLELCTFDLKQPKSIYNCDRPNLTDLGVSREPCWCMLDLISLMVRGFVKILGYLKVLYRAQLLLNQTRVEGLGSLHFPTWLINWSILNFHWSTMKQQEHDKTDSWTEETEEPSANALRNYLQFLRPQYQQKHPHHLTL